jgi:hypothetical protein
MEQAIEQAYVAATDPVTGRFLPGKSANPLGRLSLKVRARAEADRLSAEFQRLHARPPTVFESATISAAALLVLKLRYPPADPEDLTKLVNTLGRTMRRLGMGDAANPNAPSTRRERSACLA